MKPIYLDNNATTKIAPEVYDAMQPFLSEFYGNASSVYSIGRETRSAIETARKKLPNFSEQKAAAKLFSHRAARKATTGRFAARSKQIRTKNTLLQPASNTKPFANFVKNSNAKTLKFRGSMSQKKVFLISNN